MFDSKRPLRRFHVTDYEIYDNGYIFTECKDDKDCEGRVHLIAWTDPDMEYLFKLIDELKERETDAF